MLIYHSIMLQSRRHRIYLSLHRYCIHSNCFLLRLCGQILSASSGEFVECFMCRYQQSIMHSANLSVLTTSLDHRCFRNSLQHSRLEWKSADNSILNRFRVYRQSMLTTRLIRWPSCITKLLMTMRFAFTCSSWQVAGLHSDSIS